MNETFSFEPDGIRLGVVRGISYGLFGPPGEFVPQARALGAGLIRAYVYWSQIEPEPGQFRWDTVDTLLAPEYPGPVDHLQMMHLLIGKLPLLGDQDGDLAVRHPAAETAPCGTRRGPRRPADPSRPARPAGGRSAGKAVRTGTHAAVPGCAATSTVTAVTAAAPDAGALPGRRWPRPCASQKAWTRHPRRVSPRPAVPE